MSLHSVTPDDWMFQLNSSKPTRHRYINIQPFYFFYVATIHFEKPKSLCQVVSISFFLGITSRPPAPKKKIVSFPRSDHILLWSKTMGLLLLPLLYACFMNCFGWRWMDFDNKWTQLEMVRRLRHFWLWGDTFRYVQRWSKFHQCTQVFLNFVHSWCCVRYMLLKFRTTLPHPKGDSCSHCQCISVC